MNTICYALFNQVTVEQLRERESKKYLDYLQICTVVVSWYRFITFLLVTRSMSKLILTLIKMLGDAVWFLILTIIYLTIVTPVFAILFQEDSIVYVDNLSTLRTLFDSMLGNYGYSVTIEEEKYKHIAFMIMHIFISNIFMLNYLIAILSTVYEQMNEQGDFAYKSYKYQYIERYEKGMENKGYSELVVHCPPVNYFAILLLPSAFISQIAMNTASQLFSYCIFWLENVVYYIPKMILTEILLIPFIYLRTVFNIIKVEEFWNGVGFSSLWLLIGMPYMVFTAAEDIYYYLQVLRNYREKEFDKDEENEDILQDKIVIYNELIDVITGIMNIFKKNKKKLAYNEHIEALNRIGKHTAHEKADSENE